MENQDKSELVERYFLGDMNQDERAAYLEALEKDEDLRSEHDFYNQLAETVQLSALIEEGADSYFKKSSKADQSNNQPAGRVVGFRIRQWAAAAAILLLAVAGFFIYQSLNADPNEQLFLAYNEPLPDLTRMGTSRSADTQALLEAAFSNYGQANYDQAAQRFAQVEQADPALVDDTFRLYYASALLNKDEPEATNQALALLQTVQADEESARQIAARYYYGLALLKTGRLAKARTAFASVADATAPEDAVWVSNARSILADLE